MHTSTLTKHTYSQAAGPHAQDVAITPATLADGTLKLRFDPIAFPQVGINYTGTDDDGVAVPPPAVAVTG